MKDQLSNKLKLRLSKLDEALQADILKRAQVLRKRSYDRISTFEIWVERVLLKDELALTNAENIVEGQVIAVHAREFLVQTTESATMVPTGTRPVVVGDFVRFGYLGEKPALLEVLPRRTKLSRPDVANANAEKLIVANVDVIVIVVSVVSPPLHPRIIDRYLIAIKTGGAQAMIVVNKIDLSPMREELVELESYRENGVPIMVCSTQTGEGIVELRTYLSGKTVAFVGHSGVGKSSLVNAFAPQLNVTVGEVSEGYGRGTHTTTSSSLHRLDFGTILVDTPGVRSFGLWEAEAEDLAAAFPDIVAATCRFSDCTHQNEPDCGVLQMLADGRITRDRLRIYLRLQKETKSKSYD